MGDRHSLAYEVAVMHYVQGYTMDAIAANLRFSRSTVSRLIRTARDLGYVQISLRAPGELSSSLREWFGDTFGVTAHVVTVPAHATEQRKLEAVAAVGAAYLSENVTDNTIIALAWGNTVSTLARYITPKPAPGSIIVQLNGAANCITTGIPYVGEILQKFGDAYGSSVYHFPVPAFFDYPQTREALWKESTIRVVHELHEQADIAIFGVGAFGGELPSMVYSGGYLASNDLASIKDENVVGDVCTVLLREDGTWEDLSLNRRASGPLPPQLKKIPRRLCIAAGAWRMKALVAALRAGVVTDMVLDEDLANRVKKYVESTS